MGIKGVGMANLAILAKEAGFIVAGSDVAEEFITDSELKKANITIYEGFKSENVSDFFGITAAAESLMIITGAHGGFDNEEAQMAAQLKIQVLTHGEAVGKFMAGEFIDRANIEGISVAGSHGKTTISAMLATYFSLLGLRPSYIVGTSSIIPIGAAGHYGSGKYFIAEADEYKAAPTNPTPRFLYQYPKYLIINNIDFDHPDVYADLNAVKDAFARFVENIGDDGLLLINGDDENLKEFKTQNSRFKVITYGTGADNEFVISNFAQNGFDSNFSVSRNGTLIGEFELSIPGYYNAKNALAAIALLMELGVSVAKIAEVLPQ
ncbi:MAG TPA: Mur ligase family protein, partial [Gammaproteobacteria bacterium]|nr:Mur ligase family protein [Gammaproteobacteria bacterium]